MTHVLTPALYHGLVRAYGTVNVRNPGRPLRATVGHDFSTGRERLAISDPGEYYVVSCPFCSDTRFRLWVNHEWLTYQHLVICYNDDCMADAGNRTALRIAVLGHARRPVSRGRRRVPVQPPAPPGPVRLPASAVRIDDLPDEHPARLYLTSRGFDPTRLGKAHDLLFCPPADPDFPLAAGRLVIPFRSGGKVIGWQARRISDAAWSGDRKYFTLPGFAKSRTLYNIDRATAHDHVILCEGVTDVWRAGPAAVAVLGKTISEHQRALLAVHWGRKGGTVVLLLDADAQVRPADRAALAAAFGGRVVEVQLPAGQDPASLTEPEVRSHIELAAQKCGVGGLRLVSGPETGERPRACNEAADTAAAVKS